MEPFSNAILSNSVLITHLISVEWSYNNGFQNRLTIKKAIGLFFLRSVSKNIDRFCPWNMILDSQTDFTQS